MKVTVEDRRAVSAEVTVEVVEAYLLRAGWSRALEKAGARDGYRYFRLGRSSVGLRSENGPTALALAVEYIATVERRQPSAVLSDIVGYQVGLDPGRASVLRNSASARVVDAREALAKVKPRDAAGHERARVRLAQSEAELAAAARALEAATSAPPT
ncbi:hypothetical protein [Sorangium sp. So ce388]|uniref:hypothetical protein n=1 Tax=Sorangium sp. So ce388 TaxID=3133309 RepID=UPI003F5B987B